MKGGIPNTNGLQLIHYLGGDDHQKTKQKSHLWATRVSIIGTILDHM